MGDGFVQYTGCIAGNCIVDGFFKIGQYLLRLVFVSNLHSLVPASTNWHATESAAGSESMVGKNSVSYKHYYE